MDPTVPLPHLVTGDLDNIYAPIPRLIHHPEVPLVVYGEVAVDG